MLGKMRLLPTRCAICHTKGNATERYAATLSAEAFTPALFSARRLPDRDHYRIVRCNSCGLVRSDPVVDSEILADLYARTGFGYAEEVPHIRRTYGRYLAKLRAYGVSKGALLEIGCGNGFFLEEALVQGYGAVRGVEPSVAAREAAAPRVRPHIMTDIMRPGLLEPEHFDVVCLFHVLDHVPDPGGLLDECVRVLKPGGLILCISHNLEAVSARILRERSPIFHLQHTFLYNPATIARLSSAHGLQVKRVGPAVNLCSVRYLVWLAPLPSPNKRGILAFLK
jgi:SAM-dependent methyltransferase